MKLYRSKCDTCGAYGYIFEDQLEIIKNDIILALHKYVPKDSKLKIGDPWLCVACGLSKRNDKNCKIYAELTGEKAQSLINIRKRETNLKSNGFILPKLY